MGTVRFHHLAVPALALALLVPGAAQASPGCPGAGAATASAARLQKEMLCLHNSERRAHGLSRMRWNGTLARVAARYSRTMVRRHFFDHHSPDHRDHMDRIAATGYRPGAGCWTAGENLFFSAGISSPRRLIKTWMASAVHRATILHGGWRDFALGVSYGSPYGGRGMTVVALFGLRSKRGC
ncbi:MAG: hypothetical protein JW895_15710 [Thermoleophilaceae bacterium]|nr:hypothetical protein [Thermoleophilaceae bacterium]